MNFVAHGKAVHGVKDVKEKDSCDISLMKEKEQIQINEFFVPPVDYTRTIKFGQVKL